MAVVKTVGMGNSPMSNDDGDSSTSRRIAELAALSRPDDEVFQGFVPEYYTGLAEFRDDRCLDEDLYAVAVAHFELGRRRSRGDTSVKVFSPNRDRDGWHSDRSIALIVTDDVPFLVDTVRIVLERHSISAHRLVHPTLWLRRHDNGEVTDVCATGEPRDGFEAEAWTQLEIDRCDSDAAEALRDDLERSVASVHRVVADFGAMRERMEAHSDLDPILGWFASGHFVFLGAARFDVGDDSDAGCRAGSALGLLADESPIDPEVEVDGATVAIARSAMISSIHRSVRMTSVTVRFTEPNGRIVADRFVGLLASTAYRQSVLAIPSVGDRARAVLGLASAGAETHTGRSMRNVLETLPRDLVFETDTDRLALLVIDVVGLQERQVVRILNVPESVGTASTALLFIPKARFHARLPEIVSELVSNAFNSPVRDLESTVGSGSMARVSFTIERLVVEPDLDALSRQLDEATTAWIDRVREAAVRQLGESAANRLMGRIGESAPPRYRSGVDPGTAVGDMGRLADLLDGPATTLTSLVRHLGAEPGVWSMRVYCKAQSIALSDLLPLFGHLGLQALDEHPYVFELDGSSFFVYDIGVRVPDGVEIDDQRHAELRSAFEGLLAGGVEPDGFNRLIVLAGLTAAQANILRSYAKFAHQTGFAFSQVYVEETLARLPHLARLLVELFEARFDPDLDEGDRLAAYSMADAEVLGALEEVPSLDDDRICRTFHELILATVRTSAFQGKATVAFKFDPSKVPDLPEPRPAHEIFVGSARVEGVHLRGGAIARGGVRWSDRPEDYRTEVLGLVKAQMVKNAVIVPVGSKGGFVVKQPKPTREENREEVIECYKLFIGGLLDLTDNVVDGAIEHPERTVRYDDDDTYLVVAADKGTASFSDIANGISADYGYWLGDAFASGGSAGYDHKEMGITARGAWESVRRQAAVIGKNADTDEMTVAGVGDMSGDVFGNGLLRSRHLKLVAAFDHRDIFIDPDPDPAISFEERQRLFDTPRSSWADYDSALISEGGGVFSRSLKAIDLTPQMQEALGFVADRATPNELIGAILRAPVELFWNGGVGTYVKSSTESHAEVGDRANDAVRINGDELRCKIVAEGGNLGVTQLGRVEYSLGGGLIHTDAIDNSAGVDCSDHEVNIKILLGAVMAQGEMTLKQRNQLLVEMTDEVAELVLDDNQAQTLALVIARRQALPMVNVHARYLDQLEMEGWLDRSLEFLPTDKQIAERQSSGAGLQTPEFGVLIAYTKNANIVEIMRTDLPENPALDSDLINYFPTPLRERFRSQILTHRLRREIAATELINQMVNLSGISYDHRMTEDTGASVGDVTRAWVTARDIVGFPAWWDEINDLTGVAIEDQLELFLDCRRTAERCSLWYLRHRRPPIVIAAETARFKEKVQQLSIELPEIVSGPMHDELWRLASDREFSGVPAELARRSAYWRLVHTTFDVIELAERVGVPPREVATAYWEVFERLELMWLWEGIGALPRSDRWQTQARGALRDDLLIALAELTENVMETGGSVDAWMAANGRTTERATSLLTEIRRAESFDITNLSVALRQLRNLALTSVRDA
jgi:glutamate dehydrogenase